MSGPREAVLASCSRSLRIHGGTKAREINVEELCVLGMVYPMGNPEFDERPP
jgi:hypothetical protein